MCSCTHLLVYGAAIQTVMFVLRELLFAMNFFYTRDAISVWDERGQIKFSLSSYLSRRSSRLKTGRDTR